MIVGVIGFIGSGKNTVGNILVEEYGFKSVSFGKLLKDATALIFNWPRSLLEGDTDESRVFRETKDQFWSNSLGWDVTPRAALQKMGTEAGRVVFGQNLWTDALFNNLIPDQDYVITDTRFRNEISRIRKYNGRIIRVKRGPEPSWYHLAVKQNYHDIPLDAQELAQLPHISEWEWVGTPMNCVIENNGTLDDLKARVREFVEESRLI